MALFYKLCYIRLDCGTLNGGSVFYLIIDSDVNGSFLDDFQWTDDEWWIFLFSRIEWTVSVAQACSKIFRIFFSIQIYNVCFQLMFMTVMSQVYYAHDRKGKQITLTQWDFIPICWAGVTLCGDSGKGAGLRADESLWKGIPWQALHLSWPLLRHRWSL